MGYAELKGKYGHTFAIVRLNAPRGGMKVRIDGRTFVNYAEYSSGLAVPGYLARHGGTLFFDVCPPRQHDLQFQLIRARMPGGAKRTGLNMSTWFARGSIKDARKYCRT